MGYTSRFDTKFITFINRKYRKNFSFFDDYISWLFYVQCKYNEKLYYKMLEKDIWEYSDYQTGTPREREKENDDWKKMERDKYGLLSNDKYLELIEKRKWK